MSHRLLNSRRILAILIALLLLSSMMPAKASRWVWTLPQHAVEALVGWPSLPLRQLSQWFRPGQNLSIQYADQALHQRNYEDLLRANAQLKIELDALRQELYFHKAARQNLRLTKVAYRFPGVVAGPSDPLRPEIVLNQGTRHGLAVGMVVTDPANFHLLGRIVQVGPVTATVELVLRPKTRVEARFISTKPMSLSRDLVAGLVVDSKGQHLRTDVKRDTPIQVGYLAHLADPTWPAEAQGLVLGQVVAVGPMTDNPLFNTVWVTPMRSLDRLNRVLVLLPEDSPGIR